MKNYFVEYPSNPDDWKVIERFSATNDEEAITRARGIISKTTLVAGCCVLKTVSIVPANFADVKTREK